MTDCQDNSEAEKFSELKLRFCRDLAESRVKTTQEFLQSLSAELRMHEIAELVNCEIDHRQRNGEPANIEDFFETIPNLKHYIAGQMVTKQVVHETTAAVTEALDLPVKQPKKRQIVSVGDKLDDFELVAELGKGSFATVFLARQISMQRMVALKVSVDHGMEAQTLAQLDHPNIVRVYDQRPDEGRNLQLLYMQYLEGGTLLDVLSSVLRMPEEQLNGKLFVKCVDEAIIERGASPNYESITRKNFLNASWEQTICRIGFHLASALAYAHEKGVLHRDIKPANVLVGSDCSVKLADFNISSAETVVGDSKFGGSLAYMSPEQIRAFNRDDEFDAQQLDQKCDLYSLGVMLYQMLMRELPFYAMTKSRSTDGLKTMTAERENSIERIRTALQSKPPLLREALIRCLQPKLENRPSSATDLANQFKLGLDSEAGDFLFPTTGNWTLGLQGFFYTVCVAVSVLLNALAAAFVFNFNLGDAVPEPALQTFTYIMIAVNAIVFPVAIALFLYMTRSVPPAIGLCKKNQQGMVADMRLAVNRTLTAGHIQAFISGALWMMAGVIYPVTLMLFGVSLNPSDWIDFIASHWLAGISITALTYFATTYLSLKIWLPVLIENCYAEHVISTVKEGLDGLISKIPIYQFLAVCVPLLAMALLVIFGDMVTRSKFPLTVISVFGLLTIPVVMFGGNLIRSICERLLIVFRDE